MTAHYVPAFVAASDTPVSPATCCTCFGFPLISQAAAAVCSEDLPIEDLPTDDLSTDTADSPADDEDDSDLPHGEDPPVLAFVFGADDADDTDVSSFEGYYRPWWRVLWFYFVGIATCGVSFLLAKWYPAYHAWLSLAPCPLGQATHIRIKVRVNLFCMQRGLACWDCGSGRLSHGSLFLMSCGLKC